MSKACGREKSITEVEHVVEPEGYRRKYVYHAVMYP